MKKLIHIVLATLLLSAASRSIAGPPFNVDDPGTTEYRHFNITAAYISSQNSGGEAQSFPNIGLAYGLRNDMEISVSLGALSVRNAGTGRIGGFGDTAFAAKWRFKDESKRSPQFALGYQIKIPTADKNRGLGTGAVDHALWISSAKSFKRATLFANLGYNFLGDHTVGTDNLFYGLGVTYQLTEQLIVGAQVYGNARNAPGANEELAWGLGLTYNFAPDRSFLLSLGKSERGFSDLNVYAGFAFTFK